MSRLSAPTKQALEDIHDSGDPWARVRGRSQHGGWSNVVAKIQKSGWAVYSEPRGRWELTAEGKKVLKAG
jgi:hypothetical protein